MARGVEAKLRRRNRKKNEQETTEDIFGGDEAEQEFGPGETPMPPGMSQDGDADSDDQDKEEEVVVKKKKKNKNKSRPAASADPDAMPVAPKTSKGINRLPLILLILMTGSTLLPALIYASDYMGNFLQKNHIGGQIGYRMGMGAVPRKRVLSFYEKHDPNKIEDVPTILSKHYGDYPLLIKKLERKYQDYGYFLGWDQDEAPIALAMEQIQETYDLWINSYWNVYAPQLLKTGARNIRYNLAFLQKKGHKVWKKSVWPMLEPYFGVPKGAQAQKRKDSAEARKRQDSASSGGSSSGRRRKNTDFRDEEEE
jgi:hypothetical protein